MLSSSSNNELLHILTQLNLSPHAKEAYSKLLAHNEPNLSQLAKSLGVSRPHLYKTLSELEQSGLIKFNHHLPGINGIQVTPPTIILQKIREQKSQVSKVESDILKMLPELMSAYDQGNQLSKIRVFTGDQDFFNLLMSIADEERKSIIYFGAIDYFIDCVTWTNQEKWMQARVHAGIQIQALLTESSEAYLLKRKDKAQLRETRILHRHDDFITSYHVFSNKIVFWQPKAKMAILIEDQHLARMMKMMFQNLWEQAASKA